MKISAFLGHFLGASKVSGLSLEEVAKICVSNGLTGIEVTMDQAIGGGVDDVLKILFDNGMSVCGFPAFSDPARRWEKPGDRSGSCSDTAAGSSTG